MIVKLALVDLELKVEAMEEWSQGRTQRIPMELVVS